MRWLSTRVTSPSSRVSRTPPSEVHMRLESAKDGQVHPSRGLGGHVLAAQDLLAATSRRLSPPQGRAPRSPRAGLLGPRGRRGRPDGEGRGAPALDWTMKGVLSAA